MRYFFHRLPEHRPANSTTTTPPPFPKKKGKKEKENFAINVYMFLQNEFTFNAFINLQS